jgi:hypothetical protein
MVSPQRSDSTAHADALVCLSAVQLMRARRNAGVAGGEVPAAVDRLLSAVRLELATDPESVPPPIRDAVQLAGYLVRRYAIAVPRDAAGGDEPVEHPGKASGGSAGIDRGSVVPFAPCIRLGRMG